MEQLPYKLEDLIDELDKIFPNECPDIKLTDREVWFKAGQRSVVQWFITLKENEENKEE